MLVDTHCHIHEASYPLDPMAVLERAHGADVQKLICVGTSEQSSRDAVDFAWRHDGVFATVGVHPHDALNGWGEIENILMELSTTLDIFLNEDIQQNPTALNHRKLVAIGEIGLDYFYMHSPRSVQIKALEEQIGLALKYDLPVIFHIREAFEDFWPIFDNFHGLRGELHSFTDGQANLEEGLKRGLYIGVNGISTFTKHERQRVMFASIPLQNLLLETDAPFLTPIPFRGTVNEPAFVRNIAEHLAEIRGLSLEDIASATTTNAIALFVI